MPVRKVISLLLRVFRIFIDLITGFVSRLAHGQPEVLPPLKNKLLLQPATVLAEKIRKKELKSVELIEAVIARAKDVNPYINAVVDDAYDDAIEEAKKIDDFIASGVKSEEEIKRATPLLGIPFSCKEYIAVKGMYFTNGLYSRRGVRADDDADIVKKLKSSGAIAVVKTNVCELSMWWNCCNYVYGSTRNPYDTRRSPGGSTGGEGALIGSGASIIGLGSDLGGSLRIPAFMNGVFAHKPTGGVLPDVGTFPPMPEKIANFYSCLGPMCRYAADLRPVMKILTQPKKLNLDKPVIFKQLKIYYAEDDGGSSFVKPVHPEIKGALKKAIRHFEDSYSVTAKKVQLDGLKNGFLTWFHVLSEAELPSICEMIKKEEGKFNVYWELMKWCIGASKHTLPALLTDFYSRFLLPGKNSESRKETLKRFEHLREQFSELLKDNCVFFYPSQPETAPFLYENITKAMNVGYTGLFNLLGFPATHIPLGLSRGLPIGIQVIANTMGDSLTIAVAEELERSFGGWTCPGPIH